MSYPLKYPSNFRRRIEKTELDEECNLFLGEDLKPTTEVEEEIDIDAFQQKGSF